VHLGAFAVPFDEIACSPAELDRYADIGVRAFLAAYDRR
jgi:hypothetical protein